MHPILKYLCAVALLSFAAYLIVVGLNHDVAKVSKSATSPEIQNPDDRSVSQSKSASRGITPKARTSVGGLSRKPQELPMNFHGLSAVSENRYSTLSEPASDRIPLSSPQRESRPAPFHAIQLGNDVRLPAALMHQASATAATPEIAAAGRAIIDSFYRELSADSSAGQVNFPQVEDDSTRVIPAGLDADTARDRADETYRAVYGIEAFNRHSMRGALEVQLPELSE